MKIFSKAKFLTDPGAVMLYQDLPQVREEIDKLDGQPITEPYIKIGLGDCRIALLPSWCEERRDK
jgi:hypothetical protein